MVRNSPFWPLPKTDAYWTAFLCNASGILYQKELSQQVTTFAITGEYMVCGLGDPETQKFSYVTIRISDGKVSTADSAVPLWRLTGSGAVVCTWTMPLLLISSIQIRSRPIPL